MDQKGLDRINQLYKKSKEEGLTKEEKEEQKKLRDQYIQDVRRNLRGQLENISIVEPNGTIKDLSKKRK
jgi:uncharacterized protein YnzC (UPF0291/DUF896 family)